jgi:hypothetical protein
MAPTLSENIDISNPSCFLSPLRLKGGAKRMTEHFNSRFPEFQNIVENRNEVDLTL